MSHHLSIPLINPWAATPSPSSTGTSLLLSTFWGQRKIPDSGPKHWWKIFWAAVIAKGQEENIRIQHIFEWEGKKNTPAYAHIEVFSGLAWFSATQSCLISPGELICPQEAQNWGGRKWPFTHSLFFLKYPFQTMFLCSVSCWFPSVLPMRWEPSVPLQPADKTQYKKSCSPGYTPVFYHTTLSPSLLPPTAIFWWVIHRIFSAWDCKTLWTETLPFDICKVMLLFLQFSPLLLFHLFDNTELYSLSDIKSYFKNAFLLSWVLKLQ